MLKRIVPTLDRVLIKRVQPMKKTAGGILLPDSTVGKSNEGEVIAVGPGNLVQNSSSPDKFVHKPIGINIGDKVLLPEFGGSAMKIDNEDYYLFRSDEILATLKKE